MSHPPTAVTRPLITVRVEHSLGHSGRADHSSVSELYECTCLLPPSLMYALLPHTVADPLLIWCGAALHVFHVRDCFHFVFFLSSLSSTGQVIAHCLNCGQLQCTYSAPTSSSLCVMTGGGSLATFINHRTSIIFTKAVRILRYVQQLQFTPTLQLCQRHDMLHC